MVVGYVCKVVVGRCDGCSSDVLVVDCWSSLMQVWHITYEQDSSGGLL